MKTKEEASAQPGQSMTSIDRLCVDEVLRRWPSALQVFMRYRLACVGCLMAPFDRVGDVVRVYGLDNRQFLREILAAIHSEGQERAR